jgi:CPA2 family monovalent cation:H+ antiporter-2
MPFSPLETAVLAFAMGVVLLIVTQRLRMPTVLGYLFVGVILGPSGIDFMHQTHELDLFAEMGVVFLLFAIGLEVSLSQIIQMRRSVLFVGSIQVLACMTIPGITAYLLGMSWGTGFVAAAALSMSSTAVVVKQLKEQHTLKTRTGEMSLAMLLFQDLAAIPFLIIIPALANPSMNMVHNVGWAMVKGLVVIATVIFVGRFILRPLFDEVEKYDSDEIFTLTTLTVATGMAWFSYALGLSMALGAFMAGLVLGESHHRHKIQGYIRPFKDLLLGLFFITIGMLLNIQMVIKYWYWVLFLVAAILIFKTVVVAAVVRNFGRLNLQESIQTGLIMAHGGEFGFVLLSLAIQLKVMEADYGQVVLAGILITLFLCPFMIRISGPFSNRLSKID